MSTILEPQALEDFCQDFVHRLENYQLSYYLRDRESNHSKNNAIHSSIIWTREAVKQINKSSTITGSKELGDLFILISFIDMLSESSDQIYRALYNVDKIPGNQEPFCFHDVPELYKNLNNRKYFKEIRAIFSAHPVKLDDPLNKNKHRFADVPFWGHTQIAALANRKGDFYTRIWTPTRDDEDTIYFPLYINDLIAYAQLVYGRFPEYRNRLKQIANRHV